MDNCFPLVSVIICFFNTEETYLKQAIESILNQTYANYELILINDCSEIKYNKKIFNNQKIRYFRNIQNYGPAKSRNIGIENSKGKYVAIMDSDDISLPTRLEEQVSFLESNLNVVALGSWFQYIGEKNTIVKRDLGSLEYYRCCLLFDNVPTLLNSSVMIRKSILDTYSLRYNDELKIGEDYLMWVQLCEHGSIVNYKKILVYYRSHENQITRSKNRSLIEFNYHIIYDYMLSKIELKLSNFETSLLRSTHLNIKNILKLKKIIRHIILQNNKFNYLDSNYLKKRSVEQIEINILKLSKYKKILLLFVPKLYINCVGALFSKIKRKKNIA